MLDIDASVVFMFSALSRGEWYKRYGRYPQWLIDLLIKYGYIPPPPALPAPEGKSLKSPPYKIQPV